MKDTVQLSGTVVGSESLTTEGAAFVRHVGERRDGVFSLIECRDFEAFEGVAFVARPAMPQERLFDFHDEEPLLLLFPKDGAGLPNLLSLRTDFPQVPHMNLIAKGSFKWICLFGEDPHEVRRRLTPHVLAQRVLWWFEQNALGKLHRDDQALEPFLVGDVRPIYFPEGVFDAPEDQILHVFGARLGTKDEVLVADEEAAVPEELRGNQATLYTFVLPVQTVGLVHYEPETLLDLHELCQAAGTSLLEALSARLMATWANVPAPSSTTILILDIPKGRSEGTIESHDYRAFRLRLPSQNGPVDASPSQVAKALGIGDELNGVFVPLVNAKASLASAATVQASMLAPRVLTTRDEAAALNGASSSEALRIFASGMGALGSQVFAALVRRAYGLWTVVDPDMLEPHNLARHAVFDRRYGFYKAVEMAHRANRLFKGGPVASAIVADVVSPGDRKEELFAAASQAELVLDMTASTAAARALQYDLPSESPRMSLFLSPSGRDLVAFAEGVQRSIALDGIEAQYLRAVINDPRLVHVLDKPDGTLRYGAGCRDRSGRVPNELVSLHASVGSHAVQTLAKLNAPSAVVWRCDPTTFEVERVEIPLRPSVMIEAGEWSLAYDEGLLRKLDEMRKAKLPNETCGVLLGQFDASRKRLYLIDALSAPPDSEETPEGCKRGVEGLNASVADVFARTGGDVDYVGEWHSHPDGVGCRPSDKDVVQMAWIEEKMHPAGLPAVMLITCQSGATTILFSSSGVGRAEMDALPGPCG